MNRSCHNPLRSFRNSCLLALALVGLAASFGWALNPQPLPPSARAARLVKYYQALGLHPQSKFNPAALNPQPLPPRDPGPRFNPGSLQLRPWPSSYRPAGVSLLRVIPGLPGNYRPAVVRPQGQ
jgi:hypothetical protein